MPFRRRIGLGLFCSLSCLLSTKIIAVSDFTRDSIRKVYGLGPGAIIKIYEAGGPVTVVEATPRGKGPKGEDNYIVAFGGRFENKNMGRLLEAAKLVQKLVNVRLVVLGEVNERFCGEIEKFRNIGDGMVEVTGYISHSQVRSRFAGASAYVHPSIYEGFGMPLLEAQSWRLPVAASRVASIPEVAGEGAVYFNPFDVADMAQAILKIVKCPETRESLVKAGLKNLTRFSWSDTALNTSALYRHLVCSDSTVVI